MTELVAAWDIASCGHVVRVVSVFWIYWYPSLLLMIHPKSFMMSSRSVLPKFWSHRILAVQVGSRASIIPMAAPIIDELFLLLHEIHPAFSLKASESTGALRTICVVQTTWYQWSTWLFGKFFTVCFQKVGEVGIWQFRILMLSLCSNFHWHWYLVLDGVSSASKGRLWS